MKTTSNTVLKSKESQARLRQLSLEMLKLIRLSRSCLKSSKTIIKRSKPQSIKWLPRMSSLKRIGLWILKSSSSLKTRNLKKTIQFLKTRKSGESNLLEFRWMLTHEFCFCPCLLQKEQNLLLIHDIKLRSLMIWLSSGWRKLKYLQRRGLKIWLKKKWKQKTWERGKYSTSKLDLPDTNSSWDLLDLHCFTSYCIKDGVLDLFMDLRFTTRQSKL